jgi:hypothetical protein
MTSVFDFASNYAPTLNEAHASLAAAASESSTGVDTAGSLGGGAFLINVSSVGTGGELTVVLEYSDDNSTFTAEPDTTLGNATSTVIDVAGLTTIAFPQPRARYMRVTATAATDAVVYSVIGIVGRKAI